MPTLDWLNRTSAFSTAAQVPYRLLEQVSAHGKPDAGTDNLLIQGDNLEALKALLPFYRGQVKCIFIDPPYNTKSAFEHYDDNLEHAQWLSMMLPRLQLLRELLREDGSIWVTIDDNEGHYLKVLMDEVFGRGNFVASFQWQKTLTRRNDAKVVSEAHDHVLLYARNSTHMGLNRQVSGDKQRATYTNRDNDPRGDWLAIPFHAPNIRPNLTYPINTPGGRVLMPPAGRCWSTTREKYEELLADGRVYFGRDGNGMAQRKKFWHESAQTVVPWTWWPYEEAGDNREATREAKELLGESAGGIFSTPKPERLILRVLELATNPGDLVLDSFLGSGTTAAVAHKMGRRWIGIEMGEHAATHCLPRLQKVLDGEQGGISKAVGWGPAASGADTLFADGGAWNGGGFRFMRLGAPVFDAKGRIHPDVRFATLAAFVWQQETGTALEPLAAKTGTPYLGTHYTFDSFLRTEDGGLSPISHIKTPQFATYLLFNGILGDKRPASGNVLTLAVLDALLALHAQVHGATAQNGAAIPLLVFGEACRLGPARLKLANVTFKHIPYDVKAR
ncbi:MAG: DNA methylase [Burkholderiales bacterium RIFCSPLOWO2_12_FULL_61_40]|nr:MAG: DNA methylase [Burkholderiales bacterium RIFCSPLOWO2_12_FULL_61_40]